MKTLNPKLLIALIFFAFWSQSVIAQNFPTVDARNEWVVDYVDQIVQFKEIRVYSFIGTDTLINGKLYKEMIYRSVSEPGTFKSTNEYYRQDGDKVYLRHDTDEILLADFALSIGDTLYMNYTSSAGSPLVIAARDTINVVDGSQRVQLKYYCANDDNPEIPNEGAWQTMTEGLGTFGNMFTQLQSCSLSDPNYFRYIRCFYENGSLVYKDDDIVDCLISSTSNITQSSVKIYPNPGFDVLNIQSEFDIKSIDFMNLSGQIVQRNSNIDEGNVEISALPVGIYLLKIMLDNDEVAFVNFVKM